MHHGNFNLCKTIPTTMDLLLRTVCHVKDFYACAEAFCNSLAYPMYMYQLFCLQGEGSWSLAMQSWIFGLDKVVVTVSKHSVLAAQYSNVYSKI